MSESLKKKTMNGMMWNSVQRFGSMGISFISNIVLARLLSPDDYGCIGMLMIFIALAESFIDGGFGSALIQKKEPSQEDYSTVFFWNLFLSISLYCLLFFTAPAIARFYNLPLLSDVLRIQGIGVIISALTIVQSNQLRKQMNFRKLAIINLLSTVISVLVAIFMAYKGFGVWSLVAQQLTMWSVTMILLWITSKWKLTFVFSLQSFKELFSFGSFILFSNLLNTFCNNIQGILIGKFFSPATMGMYSQARKLEMIASTSISSVIDSVSYPVLASVQNNKEMMINTIRKFTLFLAYVCFPLMGVLAVVATPLVQLLYSEKWLPCVPYFQIFCVAGVAVCLQGINYYGVAAIGKSDALFKWTIVKRVMGLMVMLVGMKFWGLYGLLVGAVISSWIIYIVNAFLTSKYVGYKVWKQAIDLIPIILLTLISVTITSLMGGINLNIYAVGVIQLCAFLIIYLVISYLFGLESYKIFINTVDEFIHRK